MRKCWNRKMINTLWHRDILFYEQESKNYLFKNLEVIGIVLFHWLIENLKIWNLKCLQEQIFLRHLKNTILRRTLKMKTYKIKSSIPEDFFQIVFGINNLPSTTLKWFSNVTGRFPTFCFKVIKDLQYIIGIFLP